MERPLLLLATLGAVTGTLRFKLKPMEPTKPCHDFYESACEYWNYANDIPHGHLMWDKFLEARRHIAYQVEDALSASAELSHQEKQARILFNSCKDRYWDVITGIPSISLMQEMCRMMEELTSWPVLNDTDGALFDFNRLVKSVSRHYESWPFFSVSANIDQAQNNNTLLFIHRPEPLFRDLVRQNSTLYELQLSLYAKLWSIATDKSLDDGLIAKEVAAIARLEKDIAEIVRPMGEMVTDALAMNSKFKVSRLRELLPVVDWSDVLLSFTPTYLHDYIRSDPEVIVTDPEYFRHLSRVLIKYEARTQFNYAWWQYIVDKLMRPTAVFPGGSSTEICVEFTSLAFHEAVDNIYLARIQPQTLSYDSVVYAVFGDVQAATHALLDEESWLDERSREAARQKVASVKFVSGEDFRRHAAKAQSAYSELALNPNETFVMHTRRVASWQHSRRMALVGNAATTLDVAPLSAIMPNAMYHMSTNAIIAFPGLLQHKDIRNPSSSEALYGSLGFLLAHEMIHAIDKQGIRYGPDGNAFEWMESTTKEVFDKKLQCVEELYSSRYVPGTLFTLFVDGKRTLAENAADIDGLKIASKAYDLRRQREGLPPGNKTAFFKGFAQSLCENLTPEAAKLLHAHDNHAPRKVRVNEALKNNDEFSASFACPEEEWMSYQDKCYVWMEKPREDARPENDVSRSAASCLTVATAVLLTVLNYY